MQRIGYVGDGRDENQTKNIEHPEIGSRKGYITTRLERQRNEIN